METTKQKKGWKFYVLVGFGVMMLISIIGNALDPFGVNKAKLDNQARILDKANLILDEDSQSYRAIAIIDSLYPASVQSEFQKKGQYNLILERQYQIQDSLKSLWYERSGIVPDSIEAWKSDQQIMDKVFELSSARNKVEADRLEAEKALQEKALAERKKEIELQFSAWDGSHNEFVKLVKGVMNDPSSFTHYETKYIDQGDRLQVFMEFGGKNAFGGMVRNVKKAEFTLDGKFIREIE
jgi:hypothetical protein